MLKKFDDLYKKHPALFEKAIDSLGVAARLSEIEWSDNPNYDEYYSIMETVIERAASYKIAEDGMESWWLSMPTKVKK